MSGDERPAGWAALADPPQVAPDVKWWAGRAQQVRLAIDSLEAFRARRCVCLNTRRDLFGRWRPCEAPIGLPCRFTGLFLRPVERPKGPTLASLGLVPAHTVIGALRAPVARTGGHRDTPRR